MGEEPAQFCGLGEFQGSAPGRVAAHHPHGGLPGAEVRPHEFVQCIADGMIVQRRGQGGVQPVPLPGTDAPVIHQGVREFLIRCVFQPGIKFLRRVKRGSVRIERHTLKLGENQGTAAPKSFLHILIERAAEEDCAFHVQSLQRSSPAPQIQRLGMPAAHCHGAGRQQVVEGVEAFNL
ncbi:MAG: hypothetical protein NVS2B15_05640 [Pseudarthrobacter sp.]